MFVLFQTLGNSGKLYPFGRTLTNTFRSCKCSFKRKYSDVPKKFARFDEVASKRRAEARRSVVVQVNSDSSFNELYGYCSKYASINGIHHYKNSGGEHFMVIEFESEENLKEVLKNCSAHQKEHDVMALQSPFVWFRAVSGKKSKLQVPNQILHVKDGTKIVNEDELFADLLHCKSMSDQIQLLYDRTKLNDLGIRLRHMVARQLEVIFESLFANVAVRPFGSSVNGFGKMGCDLDLVLTNEITEEMSTSNNRLVYQEKKCEGGVRPWQRHMELVGELLELRVPGASRIQRILHARVPIVKYAHDFTEIDCDLCYNNMSGVYMSELLFLLGSLDPRVRPLVSSVRRWAQTIGLTNPHPGRWITNFPLTLMVLFFLQQKTKDGFVLPSLKYLVSRAGKEDIRIAEENLNCTYLRDPNLLPPQSYGQNTADLETLLLQFFSFYSQFDFQEKAISIYEGHAVRKPNNLPLYIVNPLEQSMNVSRNVSYEEAERLKLEVRNAAWHLESTEKQKPDDWGLLSLIEKKSTRNLKRLLRVGNSQRLLSVKDLFNEEDSPDNVNSEDKRLSEKKKEKVDMIKEERKEQKTKFKNSQIASEVMRIRRNKMV